MATKTWVGRKTALSHINTEGPKKSGSESSRPGSQFWGIQRTTAAKLKELPANGELISGAKIHPQRRHQGGHKELKDNKGHKDHKDPRNIRTKDKPRPEVTQGILQLQGSRRPERSEGAQGSKDNKDQKGSEVSTRSQ